MSVSLDRRFCGPAAGLDSHVGNPSSAIGFDESPEGHHVRFDARGRLVGITMVGVRHQLESGRRLVVALPERVEIDPADLLGVLSAA